ncbi:hypothetical protein SS50377_21422 [Spironucleus salmonicida]|uniref:Myb-like DNA-binding domain-containing protein n=1 Tax=Spironucleus salmonicida TaxID=348837 RepID=V6LNZ4_9EUKA|nr:hypothetical protein SS50377_21422 [Spironucleus salmonicida]|eukprot:EST42454.1 hypothetical protein SS50377_18023 [Spironucleus salmonicida]
MLNHQWSENDKTVLWNAVKNCGKQWFNIQQMYFPFLSVNQIKLKYYYIQRKLDNKPNKCDNIKDFIVQEEYNQKRTKRHLINELIKILGSQ